MAVSNLTLNLESRKLMKKLRVLSEAVDYVIQECEAIDNGCPVCGSETVCYLTPRHYCGECGITLFINQEGEWVTG